MKRARILPVKLQEFYDRIRGLGLTSEPGFLKILDSLRRHGFEDPSEFNSKKSLKEFTMICQDVLTDHKKISLKTFSRRIPKDILITPKRIEELFSFLIVMSERSNSLALSHALTPLFKSFVLCREYFMTKCMHENLTILWPLITFYEKTLPATKERHNVLCKIRRRTLRRAELMGLEIC